MCCYSIIELACEVHTNFPGPVKVLDARSSMLVYSNFVALYYSGARTGGGGGLGVKTPPSTI